MRQFQSFACIDWSGAKGERLKGIAAAECRAGRDAPHLVGPPDGVQHWSRQLILDWLFSLADRQVDILIGMDFSPALPFSDRQAYLPGRPDPPSNARDLWEFVDGLCMMTDDHLSVGSFVDHDEMRHHFRRHGKRKGNLFGDGIGRLREVERVCRSSGLGAAQSCFNLVGPAQVGKSSLSGMRVLHRLGGRVPVWPFIPVPEKGPVIVEIYTAIAAREAKPTGRTKIRSARGLDKALEHFDSNHHLPLEKYDDHSTDAILTAAWLRRAADRPELWDCREIEAVRHTEGWTFGVPCRMGARTAPD